MRQGGDLTAIANHCQRQQGLSPREVLDQFSQQLGLGLIEWLEQWQLYQTLLHLKQGQPDAALDAFLKYFPAVRKIVLCLDNDNAGRTRTQDIIAHLAGSGKAVEDRPPPVGKDYNDTLVQYMQEYRAHCISMDDILEETR